MAVNDDLARFNAFIADEAEQEKQNRRIKRAEQAKDKAAAEVRRVDSDSGATAEQKAEAKQAYLDATEAWRRAVAGEPADDQAPVEAEVTEADTPEEATSAAEASDDAISGEAVTEEQAAEAEGAEPPAQDAPSDTAAGDDPPTEGDGSA